MAHTLNLIAITVPCAILLVVPGVASAQGKKLSYEQAWTQCKQELSQANVPSDTLNSAARASAGGACMHKYGYRLKKSTSL